MNHYSNPSQRVCFDDSCFQVRVAETPQERQQGLQGKEELSETEGMLFVFPRDGKHVFWMKRVQFPLDIVWLDDHKRVVDVAQEVTPCTTAVCPRFTPRVEARYVLEIAAGQVAATNIAIGDKATFRILYP